MLILNTYTIGLLFIAALTGLLAVPIGFLSLKTYLQTGKTVTEEELDALADRSYLLLLIAAVVLSVKLFEWPLFYCTLHSLIPHIHGAMCIFGVAQAQPVLSGGVQVLKPLVFFLIGGWLLLHRLGRVRESPLFRTKHLFLFFVSLFIVLDSAADFAYFTSFDTGVDVACCTTVFDLAEGRKAAFAASLIGKGNDRALLLLFFGTNSSLIAFLGYSYALATRGGRFSPGTTAAGAVLAALNAVITVTALFAVIAPEVMDLPDHHCIYCMWQYAPLSIVMTALFVIGTLAPGWSFVLSIAGRRYADEAALGEYQRKLALLGMGSIGLSVCMAAFSLFLKG